jgi:hypothetical protein
MVFSASPTPACLTHRPQTARLPGEIRGPFKAAVPVPPHLILNITPTKTIGQAFWQTGCNSEIHHAQVVLDGHLAGLPTLSPSAAVSIQLTNSPRSRTQ